MRILNKKLALLVIVMGMSFGGFSVYNQSLAETDQEIECIDEAESENMDCCKTCKKGKACGDSCIKKEYTCHKPKGCACDG
ncbi:hypothetical protein N6H18_02605 [Reichenbachiella agarivorans]|uniref:Uncharacterized protein n=1 Tax=Reichenbachiella agarivorans TaxID=2979464 RepID=A0ABY6CSL1_9BACT|nr:hypothetical protein [Reichenbachiella agarivorans]UXP32849.1 hypothetical protein N6H18_02605 [Reichenbachiella agarivorans]